MAEKKFYWLKMDKNFFDRHEVKILESYSKEYVLFYIKLMCESVSHDGCLRFSDDIPYTREMLATITGTNMDIVEGAMDVLQDLGLVFCEEDGTYVITKVQDMIGAAAGNDNAVRQQRYRDKQKALKNEESNASVTESNVTRNAESNASVTDSVTNSNESKSKSKSKSKSIYAEDICSVNDFTENELLLLRDTWNQRADTHPVENIKPMTKRYENLRLCLRFCDKQRIFDEVSNIDTQAFFQKLKMEGRPVKFDWFFTPDNFQKVLEGNYREEHKPKKAADQKKTKFQNFDERVYDDDYYAGLEQKMMGE